MWKLDVRRTGTNVCLSKPQPQSCSSNVKFDIHRTMSNVKKAALAHAYQPPYVRWIRKVGWDSRSRGLFWVKIAVIHPLTFLYWKDIKSSKNIYPHMCQCYKTPYFLVTDFFPYFCQTETGSSGLNKLKYIITEKLFVSWKYGYLKNWNNMEIQRKFIFYGCMKIQRFYNIAAMCVCVLRPLNQFFSLTG